MSPGARDLIPRMLIVDPMKRMTIPEIRQHPWFQAHLPRYLAVPPPDTMQQAKKVCNAVFLFDVRELDVFTRYVSVYLCVCGCQFYPT